MKQKLGALALLIGLISPSAHAEEIFAITQQDFYEETIPWIDSGGQSQRWLFQFYTRMKFGEWQDVELFPIGGRLTYFEGGSDAVALELSVDPSKMNCKNEGVFEESCEDDLQLFRGADFLDVKGLPHERITIQLTQLNSSLDLSDLFQNLTPNFHVRTEEVIGSIRMRGKTVDAIPMKFLASPIPQADDWTASYDLAIFLTAEIPSLKVFGMKDVPAEIRLNLRGRNIRKHSGIRVSG